MKLCLLCESPITCAPKFIPRRKFCSPKCGRSVKRNTAENFWAHVKRGADDECWEWQGCRNKLGYGRVGWNNVRTSAHRVAFQLTYGVVLNFIQHICHTCDNPPCCNPKHLFLGDARANMHDMMSKGRGFLGKNQGERHGKAKLTEEMVREIRSLDLPDYAACKIAAVQYGVTISGFMGVRSRRNWAWLQ